MAFHAVKSCPRDARPSWFPLYLRKRCLAIFALAYCILICLLAGFFTFSKQHQGLEKTGEAWHYFFKYAPTAVLTLFAALWTPVEYWVKSLAPWHAMSKRPVSADESVLLDYISQNSFFALFSSLKRHDYAVTLGILGSVLLKVLIVISTALVTSEETHVGRQAAALTQAFSLPNNFNGKTVDTRPFLSMLGVTTTRNYPFGTAAEYAFQPFEAPSQYTLAQPLVNSTVDIFTPSFACQEPNNTEFTVIGSLQASIPGCNVSWKSPHQSGYSPFLTMTMVDCSKPDDPSAFDDFGNATSETGTSDERFLVCAVNATTIATPGLYADFGLDGANPGYEYYADPVTCLICQLNHTISKAMINLNMSDKQVVNITTMDSVPGRQIPGLTPGQFVSSVFSPLVQEGQIAGIENYIFINAIGNMTGMNVSNLDPFYDAETLQNSSIAVWKSLGIQVAKFFFLSPVNNTNVEVSFETLDNRLCVQMTVFVIMEVILCLLALNSVIMAFLLQQRYDLSRDPNSVIGLASVLASSMNFTTLMKGTSRASVDVLKRFLSGATFETNGQSSQQVKSIEVSSGPATSSEASLLAHAQSDQKGQDRNSSWAPFTFRPTGFTLACALPLVVMIALAILLRKSIRDDGIAKLSGDYSVAQTLSRLVPALIFVGTGLLFDQLNSTVRRLHPYHELKRGVATSDQYFLIKDYEGSLSAECLWHACKRRHYAMFASTLAIVFTPFLTIITTGLFSIETDVRSNSTLSANTFGWFNETRPARPNTSDAEQYWDVRILDNIMYLGSDLPQWTSPELALAKIQNDDVLGFAAKSAQLSIQLPALRGVMNCSRSEVAGVAASKEGLEFHMMVPKHCCSSWGLDFSHLTLENGTSWISGLSQCSDGRLNSTWRYMPGINGFLSDIAFSDWTCPTTVGVFAEVDHKDTVQNITAFTCMPYVESVLADALFDYPSFNLSTNQTSQSSTSGQSSVQSIESTKQYFNNESLWTTGALVFASGNQNSLMQMNLSTPNPLARSDAFFQAIFQGIDPATDPSALLGPNNADSLFAAMENTYRILMAQALGGSRRVDNVSASAPQPGNGELTYQGSPVLVQSPTATYILIGLLALVLLCGVITFLTFKVKGLVGPTVSTVSGKAGLLAESNLVEHMNTSLTADHALSPDSSAWFTDEKGLRLAMSKDLKLRLGWWEREAREGEGQEKRYGIDIIGQDRDSSPASSLLDRPRGGDTRPSPRNNDRQKRMTTVSVLADPF